MQWSYNITSGMLKNQRNVRFGLSEKMRDDATLRRFVERLERG
jgi:hypothetical protein